MSCWFLGTAGTQTFAAAPGVQSRQDEHGTEAGLLLSADWLPPEGFDADWLAPEGLDTDWLAPEDPLGRG
jgi:hypothetical protein